MPTVLQGCNRRARWWSGAVPLAFGFPLGRVAEWQTRWLQVPVSARTWGFKSPLAHQVVHLSRARLEFSFEMDQFGISD